MRVLGPVQFRYAPGALPDAELEKLARVYLGQLQATLGDVKTGAMIRTGPGWSMRVAFAYGRPIVDITTTPVEEDEETRLTKEVVGIIARPRSFSNPHGWGPPFVVDGSPTTPPAGTVGTNPPHDVAVYEFNGSSSQIKRFLRGVDYEYGNIHKEQVFDSTHYLTSYWGYQSKDIAARPPFFTLSATAGDSFDIRKGFTPIISGAQGRLVDTTYQVIPFRFYINGTAMIPMGPGIVRSLNAAFIIKKLDGSLWARWVATVPVDGTNRDELWEEKINTTTMSLIFATLNRVCVLIDGTDGSVGAFASLVNIYSSSSDGLKLAALALESAGGGIYNRAVVEWTFDSDGAYIGANVLHRNTYYSTNVPGVATPTLYEITPQPFTDPNGVFYGDGGTSPGDTILITYADVGTPEVTTYDNTVYLGVGYDRSDNIVTVSERQQYEDRDTAFTRSGWVVLYHPGGEPPFPEYPIGVGGTSPYGWYFEFDSVTTTRSSTTIKMGGATVATASSSYDGHYHRVYGSLVGETVTSEWYETNEDIDAIYADILNRDCIIYRRYQTDWATTSDPENHRTGPVFTIEFRGKTLLTMNDTSYLVGPKPVISAYRDKQTGLLLLSAFIAITDTSSGSPPEYTLVCEAGNFFAGPAFIAKADTQDSNTFLFPIGPYRAEWVL